MQTIAFLDILNNGYQHFTVKVIMALACYVEPLSDWPTNPLSANLYRVYHFGETCTNCGFQLY